MIPLLQISVLVDVFELIKKSKTFTHNYMYFDLDIQFNLKGGAIRQAVVWAYTNMDSDFIHVKAQSSKSDVSIKYLR